MTLESTRHRGFTVCSMQSVLRTSLLTRPMTTATLGLLPSALPSTGVKSFDFSGESH